MRKYKKIPEMSRVFEKREILENRAFEKKNKTYEEIRENDKNTFHLPRQEFPFCLNFLILCGFPQNRSVHYNDFTTFEKCSDMTETGDITNICVSPVFHSCNMITSL